MFIWDSGAFLGGTGLRHRGLGSTVAVQRSVSFISLKDASEITGLAAGCDAFEMDWEARKCSLEYRTDRS